jgi:hypothetical protein
MGNRYVEAASTLLNGRQEIFVRPIKADATTIELKGRIRDYRTKLYRAARAHAEPHLDIKEADFHIFATPIMGLDQRSKHEASPSYSIPTPIVRLDRVTIENAQIILMASGVELPIYIKTAELKAQNGRFEGDGNFIEGLIQLTTVNNFSQEPDRLGPMINIERSALNPDYDQDRFNQSYSNTPFLDRVLE